MTGVGGEPCLVVFARAPVAGQVKTRLCQAGAIEPAVLTAEQAAAVHAAFVADVCHSGARSGIRRRRLYVAGDGAHPYLVELARETGFTICLQAGADLGARMGAAIVAELGAGASAVVLIGTDSPTLPTTYLQRAAAWLGGTAEVVLGPATDGGYYLIGARQPVPALFAAGIRWGTAQVLPETLRRLRQLAQTGLRVALLPFFYDVDTPDDLRLLACHLGLGLGLGRSAAGRPGPGHPLAENAAADLLDLDELADRLTGLHAPASRAVLTELGWL